LKVIEQIEALRKELDRARKAGQKIGLVPTMGYLHEGHLSLIDIARQKSDVVVMSLFVNPTQFGPNEDLNNYPRDFASDERLARERGTDIIFYPAVEEMYPSKQYTYVITEELSGILCGAYRSTHFRGVTTVVAKLFNIIQPDLAVFGQKDHQQAILLRKMVADLNFPIEIIMARIVREPSGLAMSSRNVYLNPAERRQAPVIYAALQKARIAVQKGETNAMKIKALIREEIARSSLAEIQYVEVVNNCDLASMTTIEPGTFAAVAVYYGRTRLIDNIYLMDEKPCGLDPV